MRRTTFGPAAIAVATLLTVFASVGLHPEPADGATISAPGPVVQGAGHAVRSSGSHDCQICLTHRTVALSSLQDIVFDRGSAVFAPPQEEPSARGLALPPLHDGRAPPSA